jgi:hypothetical protein
MNGALCSAKKLRYLSIMSRSGRRNGRAFAHWRRTARGAGLRPGIPESRRHRMAFPPSPPRRRHEFGLGLRGGDRLNPPPGAFFHRRLVFLAHEYFLTGNLVLFTGSLPFLIFEN